MGQIKENKRAILITGTIVPNSNFVAHTNTEQRRQEYMAGFLFYSLQFPDDDIYFLENSSYNFNADEKFLSLLKETKITLMKFPVSDKFSEGKGYQEFEMIDGFVEKYFEQYKSLIKITGRYKVLNIKEISTSLTSDMLADSHKKHRVTQTNVFCVTSDFYKHHIKSLYLQVNDAGGRFIEHVVYEKLITENVLNKVNLFSENPVITGFSGSYGGTLSRNKYKMMLRNMERKVLRIFDIHQFLIEY
ncbi:MAG TPA: hypothetical protein VNZ49_06365 [Bacteroidia bacterium]|jgi:hypothetical protein|nr:hypothetical protein [Bacteroidia bacterium]